MTQENAAFIEAIIAKSKELGADLAGVVRLDELRRSPSHSILPKLDSYDGVGTKDAGHAGRTELTWAAGMKSLVVLVLAHPPDQPALDWWRQGRSGGTEGNRRLMEIGSSLCGWLSEAHGIDAVSFPYYVERGGAFLKDAAVLAGLGCLGRNNLLITEEYGPRVRLRAVAVPIDLPATGPVPFDPCAGCHAPCREVCPQGAFDTRLYSADAYGLKELPGRAGDYDRHACNVRMEEDEARAEADSTEERQPVRYCRRCELACVQGR